MLTTKFLNEKSVLETVAGRPHSRPPPSGPASKAAISAALNATTSPEREYSRSGRAMLGQGRRSFLASQHHASPSPAPAIPSSTDPPPAAGIASASAQEICADLASIARTRTSCYASDDEEVRGEALGSVEGREQCFRRRACVRRERSLAAPSHPAPPTAKTPSKPNPILPSREWTWRGVATVRGCPSCQRIL